MKVLLLRDDLLIIFCYILGLILMTLFEYKIAPKIGNVPNKNNIFYNRFKFAQFIVLLRSLYLIVKFTCRYI